MTKARVLIVSSVVGQDAGIVADTFLDLFKDRGHDSVLLTTYYKGTNRNIISLYRFSPNHILSKLRNRLLFIKSNIFARAKTIDRYYFRGFYHRVSFFKTRVVLRKIGIVPDIIIVLFNENLLSFKNINELSAITGARVFFSMMDMASMTGGCHYNWDCLGYQYECRHCPAIVSTRQKKVAHRNYQYKKRYLDAFAPTLLPVGEWQMTQSLKSGLFIDKRQEIFHLFFNEENFCPGERNHAREALGLPTEKKLLLFGSVNVYEERKGAAYLLQALDILAMSISEPEKIEVVIVGRCDIHVKIPFKVHLLGYLSFDNLPKAYQAADVFVSPSIQDAGPTMINQAILCGLPVVSFGIGIAQDLVVTGKTGYLAKVADSNDLAQGLKEVLEMDRDGYQSMCNNCRADGLRLVSRESQYRAFMEICDLKFE